MILGARGSATESLEDGGPDLLRFEIKYCEATQE